MGKLCQWCDREIGVADKKCPFCKEEQLELGEEKKPEKEKKRGK